MAPNDRPLDGTVALVTGASKGLGRIFAVELATAGAAVMVVARSEAELHETARLVRAQGVRCEALVGDVTVDATAAEAIHRAEERLGPVDLLVNNAGAAHYGAVADVDLGAWWAVLEVNLRAPMVWTQAVLKGMRARRRGRIVNVSSPGAYNALPYISSYAASKAGLSQVTSALALEVAGDGVVALALGPAAMTDMVRSTWENDVMPQPIKDAFHRAFNADPDGLLALSLAVFRCMVHGDADHVSGEYIGMKPLGGFDTPADVAARPPSAAGVVLAGLRHEPTH